MLKKPKKVRLKDCFDLIMICFSYIPGKVLKLLSKEIWLISEREADAQDNGYWLFKYVREFYPDMKVYYPIKYESAMYLKVQSLGNTIRFGGFVHHILFWACSKNISAHIGNGMPSMHLCYYLNLWGIYSFKNIFIQHGIILNTAPYLFSSVNKIDLFTCTSLSELDFVKNTLGYGLKAQCLGMCRYDSLVNTDIAKNTILFMPTWRKWLYKRIGEDKKVTTKRFLESKYYKSINELLTNVELQNFLKLHDLKLIVYLHNDMQQYNSFFKDVDDIIIIADKYNFDIQQLISSSSLMITDYSSVFFDFSYLKKPVIFYQFDYAEYRKMQYSEGYFLYNRDGFGPVVHTLNDLLKEIYNSFESSFTLSDIYLQRIKVFYRYHDKKNCERTFEAIKELV